ncbi:MULTISPECIES: RNA 2',3'-cyclic phosphodiesterase [Bacillaceae]|uniref:RNA 2',3'-cyclic phosphodiesterase n=1 Tax=Oceanobacillus caeni TaxID=405946 RepID=A0ABR5MGD4_9BACI|nr:MULTISPECIES: RNA 2',3'-cyclic phosphodiesterase [Bacillaceae]KPH71581.1 2'-5' RNA ligase [Oceanobacillus caeni]MED4476030.1 RNA 2',3'-cyclic phosphodiesterase [Oceanobacillus caeni]
MGQSPHYFIAIQLSKELQNTFALWQNKLQGVLPYKQWYNKKDLHITLKFLGAVNDEKLEELTTHLKRVEELPAFSLEVGTLGTFGNPKSPRVLWAGVERVEPLIKVQQIVEQGAFEVGFPKENRNYSPHITLAKKWNGKIGFSYGDVLEKLKKEFTSKATMHVSEITLFQIHPNRKQKYEPIKKYKLR